MLGWEKWGKSRTTSYIGVLLVHSLFLISFARLSLLPHYLPLPSSFFCFACYSLNLVHVYVCALRKYDEYLNIIKIRSKCEMEASKRHWNDTEWVAANASERERKKAIENRKKSENRKWQLQENKKIWLRQEKKIANNMKRMENVYLVLCVSQIKYRDILCWKIMCRWRVLYTLRW